MKAALRLAMALLFFTLPALAEQVYVEPATGDGIPTAELTSVTELVRTTAGDLGAHLVDSASQADFTLRPRLMRLGEAYVLGVEKVKDGQVVFASRLKAGHLEELDKVATRVTRSVMSGTRAVADTRVDEVTDDETHQGLQRRPARRETYVAFGPAFLGNLNTQGVGYNFDLAYAFDVNRAVIKLFGDFSIKGGAFLLGGGLGAQVFLTMTDISPFLEGDFGFGVAKIDNGSSLINGETVGGFQFGGGAGVQFLRASAINVELAARASVLLNPNIIGNPKQLTIRLGLYF